MTAPSFGIAPPGWYTDPANPSRQRWFDGARWTDRVQATPASAPVVAAPPPAVVPPPPPAPPAPEPAAETVEPAPAHSGRRRTWWVLGLAVVGLVVAAVVVTLVVRATSSDGGAGDPTGLVDTLSIEADISAGIADRTGVATTVQCPERIAAGEVRSFQCVATDADGVTTTVDVQIVDVAGNWTWDLG